MKKILNLLILATIVLGLVGMSFAEEEEDAIIKSHNTWLGRVSDAQRYIAPITERSSVDKQALLPRDDLKPRPTSETMTQALDRIINKPSYIGYKIKEVFLGDYQFHPDGSISDVTLVIIFQDTGAVLEMHWEVVQGCILVGKEGLPVKATVEGNTEYGPIHTEIVFDSGEVREANIHYPAPGTPVNTEPLIKGGTQSDLVPLLVTGTDEKEISINKSETSEMVSKKAVEEKIIAQSNSDVRMVGKMASKESQALPRNNK